MMIEPISITQHLAGKTLFMFVGGSVHDNSSVYQLFHVITMFLKLFIICHAMCSKATHGVIVAASNLLLRYCPHLTDASDQIHN